MINSNDNSNNSNDKYFYKIKKWMLSKIIGIFVITACVNEILVLDREFNHVI